MKTSLSNNGLYSVAKQEEFYHDFYKFQFGSYKIRAIAHMTCIIKPYLHVFTTIMHDDNYLNHKFNRYIFTTCPTLYLFLIYYICTKFNVHVVYVPSNIIADEP